MLTNRHLPTALRLTLARRTVWVSLLWLAETWYSTKALDRKLNSCLDSGLDNPYSRRGVTSWLDSRLDSCLGSWLHAGIQLSRRIVAPDSAACCEHSQKKSCSFDC